MLRITRPNTRAGPIVGGLATPALLAQVLVGKYCDHTPLYWQAQIFARRGVEVERSTLAGWVGGAYWWLDALDDRPRTDEFASDHRFAIEDWALWVYAGDPRSWGGPALPAAVYIFAPDRRGPSAQTTRGDVVLAARRAHMRRKFHEALRGIAGLSTVEVQVRGERCH
ncbi:MAG: transposase [Rhodospirillales bacterium]|nr:transposase [Rhodospirillales bacterium]